VPGADGQGVLLGQFNHIKSIDRQRARTRCRTRLSWGR
jgi:hypothetical protein